MEKRIDSPRIKEIQKSIEMKEEEIFELKEEMLQEAYKVLAGEGITVGTVVEVERERWKKICDTTAGKENYYEKGIFSAVIVEYESLEICLKKMKKDGSAHSTAHLYIGCSDKIRVAK